MREKRCTFPPLLSLLLSLAFFHPFSFPFPDLLTPLIQKSFIYLLLSSHLKPLYLLSLLSLLYHTPLLYSLSLLLSLFLTTSFAPSCIPHSLSEPLLPSPYSFLSPFCSPFSISLFSSSFPFFSTPPLFPSTHPLSFPLPFYLPLVSCVHNMNKLTVLLFYYCVLASKEKKIPLITKMKIAITMMRMS